MSKTPMTEARRDIIVARILKHAFEAREAAHKKAEAALFVRALRDIHGEGTLKRIARLPAEWFAVCGYQSVAADGWKVSLRGAKNIRIPHRTFDACEPLKDATLIADVRAWAMAEKTRKEERSRLESQTRSLLRGMRTVEAFLAAMPAAEAMLKDVTWATEAGTSVAVTADRVLAGIAAARGEAEYPA